MRIWSPYDVYTLVASDGSLLTLIALDGAAQMVGAVEFEQLTRRLGTDLATAFVRSGHILQFVFQRDPDASERVVDRALAPAIATSRKLGLQLDDLFAGRRAVLTEFCAAESVWIAAWTRLSALAPAEAKQAKKDRYHARRSVPTGATGQDLAATIIALRDRHASFVGNLLSTLEEAQLLARPLTAHEAARQIRAQVDPEFTDDDWRAWLPGDLLPLRWPEGNDDFSHLLYPPLREQVFPREAEQIDLKTVRIGDRLHSPVVMTLGPQQVEPFQRLFNRLLDAGIPFRASFLLEGDGLGSLAFKNLLASFLGFASTDNKRINQAIDELKARDLAGETIVRLRVICDTWAYDLKTLRLRASALARAIQSWGSCETTEVSGDPLLGLVATLPGLTPRSPAPVSAAPLMEAIQMLPVTRPASPWQQGAMALRSPDGKLLPYQPGSSLQTAWVELGIAPMGGGKSVFLNANNLSLCLLSGLTRLPWISIIDIGPSSSGLISLLQGALPPHQKHLAAYHRLRMTRDYAINPFDTPLGCHAPLPNHRAFLLNLLSLLATPLNATAPYDGVAGIAGTVIDAVYEELGPGRNPRRYDPGADEQVRQAVERANLHVDAHTTWWEIVDGLFDADDIHHAGLAQRYAVPLLADCASMARREGVTSIYKGHTPSGEPVTDFFWRSLMEAISNYPILREPTRFDLGEARVVSLDLDEVAPRGGEAADRQTAVMYMLARHVLGAKFFLMPAHVALMPPRYRAWHAQQIEQIREDHKRMSWDEFHRVSRNSAIAAQVVGDIETSVRESRKWNLHVSLFSQDFRDIPDILVELATSIFILGAGTETGVDRLVERFGLTPAARYALLNRITKPSRKGANFLALFRTERGRS